MADFYKFQRTVLTKSEQITYYSFWGWSIPTRSSSNFVSIVFLSKPLLTVKLSLLNFQLIEIWGMLIIGQCFWLSFFQVFKRPSTVLCFYNSWSWFFDIGIDPSSTKYPVSLHQHHCCLRGQTLDCRPGTMIKGALLQCNRRISPTFCWRLHFWTE